MNTLWLVLLGLWAMLLSASWGGMRNNSGWRLTRLERRVELILKHLALDPDKDVNPQVLELMKTGNKIQAIKLHREQTGAGLMEAKDYVESL